MTRRVTRCGIGTTVDALLDDAFMPVLRGEKERRLEVHVRIIDPSIREAAEPSETLPLRVLPGGTTCRRVQERLGKVVSVLDNLPWAYILQEGLELDQIVTKKTVLWPH
jgi:hypothetical protein